MNKYTRKLLPYIIAILIVIGVGVNQVNASTIQDEVLDRVAEKIANAILGDVENSKTEESMQVEEPTLGFTSSAQLVTDNNAWMKGTSRAIYFGATDATYGIRDNAGTMQYKNSSGSWSSLGGTTPGDEGWVADANNLKMYQANNIAGNPYPIIISEQATSSPADANTELYVGGNGGFVVEGTTDIGGSFQASSTGEFTSNLTGYADFTVYSGARIGVGSTGTHLTALANDSLFVEGESEIDGAAYFDGALWASSTLAVTGNTSLVGTLNVLGLTTLANASSTNLTASTYFNVGGANGLVLTDGSILDVSGAISFGDETLSGSGNWTTTGNIAGAAGTFSGNLAIDTNTLYVLASGNAVGIGTTTPNNYGAKLAVADVIQLFDSTSPYDELVRLFDYAGDDDGAIAIFANSATTTLLTTAADSYINTTSYQFGIGTTTPTEALTAYDGILVFDSTSPYDKLVELIDSSDDGVINIYADATATISLNGNADSYINTNTLYVDIANVAGASGVAIGSTTAQNLFQVGSSTPTNATGYNDASFSGKIEVDGAAYFDSTVTITSTLAVDTNTLKIDATNNYVGVGTTTPSATFAVGTSAAATTTVDFSRTCMRMTNEAGVQYWCRVNAAGTFSCTTASCQ